MDVIKVFSIPGAVRSANFDSGIVEAIVSVTGNQDLQDDIIMPGAYKKTIQLGMETGRLPKILKQHERVDWLGKTIDAEEYAPGDHRLPESLLAKGFGGVYVKGEFTMEDPVAKAVHAHLKRGVIDEFSVGFQIDRKEDGEEDAEIAEGGIRKIKTIHPWREWSPVLWGANPITVPIAVKQQQAAPPPDALEMLEEAARALGVDERTAYMLGLDFKSNLSTQAQRNAARFKLRVNGKVKYPINDCSDVRDAWALRGRSSIPTARVASYVRRAASKLNCSGPWNSGKEADEAAEVILSYDADQLARIEKAYEALTLGVHARREMVHQDAVPDDDEPRSENYVTELSSHDVDLISAATAAVYKRLRQ